MTEEKSTHEFEPRADEPNKDEDAAVDEIAKENALQHTDDQIDQDVMPEQPTEVVGAKSRSPFHILRSKKFWFTIVSVLLVAFIFAWLITPSRVWMLNTIGQRADITINATVATNQGTPPTLKNVAVVVNGKTYHTDDRGNVKISVPFGNAHIAVSKQGYTSDTKDTFVDFDPFFYKLGGKSAEDAARNIKFSLTSVGISLQFTVKDWLSGNLVTTGDFSIGDVSAQPNGQGVVSLIIPATDAKMTQLTAKFGGKLYSDATFDVALDSPEQNITVVPAGKDYFISRRSGQLGVYSVNIDGSSPTQVVASNSYESGDMAFSASPSGTFGVLASVRDSSHDNFGTTQQKLYLVDLSTNKLTELDQALKFKFVDWSGNVLVYIATEHDQSGGTTERIGSLDTSKTSAKKSLATSATFTVARVSLGGVVYLTGTRELHMAKVNGSGDKTLGQGVRTVTQTTGTVIVYQTDDSQWHQYDINTDRVLVASPPTSASKSFLGYLSADSQTQIVVDIVDGKRTLIAKRVADGGETTMYTGNDLSAPVKWVQNTIVYRAAGADWAVSTGGGKPKKITDAETLQHSTGDYFEFN